MLEAFIIDQLKNADEETWEPVYPVLEFPLLDDEYLPPKKEEERICIINLN